jgi:hypothetical protein
MRLREVWSCRQSSVYSGDNFINLSESVSQPRAPCCLSQHRTARGALDSRSIVTIRQHRNRDLVRRKCSRLLAASEIVAIVKAMAPPAQGLIQAASLRPPPLRAELLIVGSCSAAQGGRIIVAGMTKEITCEPIKGLINGLIDDAYGPKYSGCPDRSLTMSTRAVLRAQQDRRLLQRREKGFFRTSRWRCV